MSSTVIKYFKYEHLREGELREMSKRFAILALELENLVPDNAEKSAGMRKLLEAKDCFVRSILPE
jgi:hypothetical protein